MQEDKLGRRTFMRRTLAGAGGAVLIGSAGCVPAADEQVATASPIPEGKNPADFIMHGKNPLTLETRRGAFRTSVVVPYETMYVRNNLPFPDAAIVADPDAWEVSVEGVGRPGTVTVGDPKKLGLETVAMVLQCSGNGRAFFDHEVSGSPWSVGAAACAVWSGVPVRQVIQAMGGAASDARYLTGTGGEDLPEGVDPDRARVERSIPIAKALDDTLLAWEMNAKSWINGPSGEETIEAGDHVIHGVAFGGSVAARRVEVSIDGGGSWEEARFTGPDLGRYAWRQFVFPARLEAGRHDLACRATDDLGNVQPTERVDNERGYGNNSWRDHAVTATAA